MTEKSLSDFRVFVDYRVPYADTDQMGVVYYGNYLAYFERSRNELLRRLGIPYAVMEEQGVMLPVIEAQVQYRRPGRYDDILQLWAWCESIAGARMKICNQVCRGDELLARGYTIHAHVRRSDMRPERVPESFIERLTRAAINGGDNK